MNVINLADKTIGESAKCFIIAEAGVNHNGDMALATQLIDVAVDAKADAIKFQTFKAERLVTFDAPKAEYQKVSVGTDESQFEMLRRLELSYTDHQHLFEYCKNKGILLLSTPFDEKSADLLEELGIEAFKIPSGEITNIPYIEHISRKQKPLIVSTGMSNLAEVEAAVDTIVQTNNDSFALLHCVSNYPAIPSDTNLRAMDTLRYAFDAPVGYSDHTMGVEISIAAVARGAAVIEKHFTLDRNMEGPDHRASLEPHELKSMVTAIRNVEVALGTGRKVAVQNELDTRNVARKSLVAANSLAAGTVLTESMIVAKRPGTGIAPSMKPLLIGRTIKQSISAGALFDLDIFM